MEQTIEETIHPLDAAALRHRWGEHIERDLREWLDDGYPTQHYRFSAYRVDMDDWSILERIRDGEVWRVDVDVWSRLDFVGWSYPGAECQVTAGSLVWVVGIKYHRMAVRCVVEEPDDFEAQCIPETVRNSQNYRGFEVLISVADFSHHMHLAEKEN